MPLNNVSATLRRVTPAWWLALIGPLLLIDFPAAPFANDGCDPWYVFGLYHDLPQYVQKLSWARQPARFATNLPGYFLTHIFYGIAADYALFLLIYTLAVIFLFKAASLLLSQRESILVALFFALSPYIVANYSWTLSAPAVTYEAIALFCAVRAVVAVASRKRLMWMFISGLAWGAALNSHLASLIFGTFINFFFALCVLFEIKSPLGERIKLIILSGLLVIAGVAIFNACMGVVAVVLFDAPFSVILQQMLYMPDAMKSAEGYSLLDQHLSGSKMGAFLLGVIISATAAVSYGHRMVSKVELTLSQRRRFAIALAFLLTFACLLAHEILFRGIFLQYSDYFYMLWPFLALAIFAIEFEWDRIPIPVPLLYLVLGFVGLSSRTFSGDAHAQAIGSLAVALLAGGLAILFLNVRSRAARTLIACAFAVVLTGTTFVWRTVEAGFQIWQPRVQGAALPAQYQRLHFGLKFLNEILDAHPTLRFPKFWTVDTFVDTDTGTADGFVYATSYFACALQSFPDYDPKFPSSWQLFSPGDTVVVVARGPGLVQRMNDAFNKINLVPKIIGSMTMEDAKGSYEIIVTTVAGKRESVLQER